METEEEALAHIKRTRDELLGRQRHNVLRLHHLGGGAIRYSDDGEPGGTAGMPVLNVLQPGGDLQRLLRCHPLLRRDTAGCRRAGAGLWQGLPSSRWMRRASPCSGSGPRCVSRARTLFERVRLDVAAFGGQVQDTDFAADVTLNVLLPEEQAAPFLLPPAGPVRRENAAGGHGNVLPGLPGGKIGGMRKAERRRWRNSMYSPASGADGA